MDLQLTVDLAYLEKNKSHFLTASVDYVRLDSGTATEFENIYKRNINPRFILTKWCSACILDMVRELAKFYETTKNSHSDSLPSQEKISERETRKRALRDKVDKGRKGS